MRQISLFRGLSHIAVTVVVLIAAAPSAAGSWMPQTVPDKQGLSGRSAAVSCVGSTMCMAVGAHMNPAGQQRALTQVWNGSSWTAKAVPVPAGATNTRLAAVSCTAADACTAVGSYALPPDSIGGARDQNALVVRWNGTAWARQTVPLPAGTIKSYFNGVSCTSATACKAVGGYRNGSVKSGTLVEHWNGTSWTIRTSPNPPGATFSSLDSISCVGTSCMAVGGFTEAPGGVATKTFAARFNGTAWSLTASPPTPDGAKVAGLNGVSCTAATACTAVGGYSTTNYQFADTPLAARWDGTSWTSQSLAAKPQSVQKRELTAVSCSSATKCTAVGPEMDTDPTGGRPHVERWNGTSWAVQVAPKPAVSGFFTAWFTGVSCNSGGCTAVGGSSAFGDSTERGTTLAERQTATGTSWAIQTSANGSGAQRTNMMDVACASATSCVGVGSYLNARAVGPVVAHWNGTSWTHKTAGAPFGTGRGGDGLNSVSCTSSTACMAVGGYSEPKQGDPTFDVGRPEAQHWNGTSWSSMKMTVPADASFNVSIIAVGCSSATACVAVGDYDANNTKTPLIEHWDGTSWTIKTAPMPAGATRVALRGVSCTASTACTVVGGYATQPGHLSDKPLALRWNGTSWALQNPPAPAGAMYADFTAVSCRAPKPCTAVGAYSTTDPYWGQSPIAERWGGTSWAMQSAGWTALTDVSCPTLTSCTAVGSSVAQGWDGASWTSKGYLPGSANGVSCTSASACTTVGSALRTEMISRVIFAGLTYVNGGSGPTAARYSDTQMSAPSRAPSPSGATQQLTAPAPAESVDTALSADDSSHASTSRPELDSNQRPTP